MRHIRKLLVSILALTVLGILGCDDTDMQDDAMNTGQDQSSQTTRFTVSIENVSGHLVYGGSGVFAVPDGASEPAPAFPGDSYSFSFYAAAKDRLSLATMFVHSNDYFYAPGDDGLALFDEEGMPVTGDITSMFGLYDAGTEADEPIASGADQPVHQSGPDTGADDPVSAIREVDPAAAGAPAIEEVIRVSLDFRDGMFTATIRNVSDETTIKRPDDSTTAAPISPGVWVVHAENAHPLFRIGQTDSGHGLESLAEDGDPARIAGELLVHTGPATPLAPGAYAVHDPEEMPLFTEGERDMGDGLEMLAEDGDPSVLVDSLEAMSFTAGAFSMPDGSDEPGPLLPGSVYRFTVDAKPGDRLSFATMYVKSNDLFFATGDEGIALFAGTTPRTGDITGEISLWDAGTEKNEAPGYGPNQPLNQTANTEAMEESIGVHLVDDHFHYAMVDSLIRVTLAAN